MKRFVFAVRYSQTDSDIVVIDAPNKVEAARFADKLFCLKPHGAHHADFVCEIPFTVYKYDCL